MNPEEIDKIFKERLGNTSPTPPADLWNRLQSKLEEETPHQIKLEKEKRGFMWIHSSIAATLALLLTVGVVFYNIKTTPEVSQTLTVNDAPVLEETPVLQEPKAIAKSETEPEKISDAQATQLNQPASSKSEGNNKTAVAIKGKVKALNQTAIASAAKATKQVVKSELVNGSHVAEKKAEQVAMDLKPEPTTVLLANASDSNLDAQAIEITIKRSGSNANAMRITEDEQPNELDKKTVLAKNIFKQVRNLANGEQVELADLGIRADKVALEAQIGKQKFSKVINL